jgi:hypothetical protein
MPPTVPSEEATIDHHSRSALATTKRNLRYLYNPTNTSSTISSRRTRALLRVVRSSLIFVFWRIVRYAKYVAIGSLVATLGAGAFGTVVSGAGFVLAPTGILGTVAAGSVYGVGKFVVRRVRNRWGERGGWVDEEEEEERVDGRSRVWERDVEAMPW